jgi:type IV pilus assembly protein PilZ
MVPVCREKRRAVRTFSGASRMRARRSRKTFHMPPLYQLICKAMSERREHERVPITLRVDYSRMNSFFADYTKNISKGGTFIRTTKPLDVDTSFVFVLNLPEGKKLELSAVVKWNVTESEATADIPPGMGIQFVFSDDAQRMELESYVSRLMRDALGPELAAKLLGKPGA